MQELDDIALLQEYVAHDSGEAFAILVARHVNKVYSAALRHTRNPHQAEEITQTVFVILAQKARRLGKEVILSGWLYQTARLTAVTFIRSEIRRARREQEAQMQNLPDETKPDVWTQIAPLLDTAMAGLSETDRHAVVLRFFDGRKMKEVGALLGLNEVAARQRVGRAVEKMRLFFSKRGVVVPAAVLTAAISTNAVQAAPIALAKTATALAIAKGATASSSTLVLIKGTLKTMAITKMQLGVTALVITGAVISLMVQHQNQIAVREQNEALRQQITRLQTENEDLSKRMARRSLATPRLPAPTMQATASIASPAEDLQSSNLLARVAKMPMTAAQAENFLTENHRSAASLLAAFRTTGSITYLEEAMRKFPEDPQVAFEAALRKDALPEEKRAWIDALKKSAPDNPLANYLSALDYFNSGHADQAVQELVAASGKKRFNDYFMDRLQGNEEAYRSAGYSEVETRVGAAMGPGGFPQPQLNAFKDLTFKMVDLSNSYRQAGDETSAQTVLQMAVNMGELFDGSKNVAGVPPVTRAFGFAIERKALEAMDPTKPFGPDGGTVKDQLDNLAQEKLAIGEMCKQLDVLYPKASPQDMINFLDRARLFGDEAAMKWLKQKYAEK